MVLEATDHHREKQRDRQLHSCRNVQLGLLNSCLGRQESESEQVSKVRLEILKVIPGNLLPPMRLYFLNIPQGSNIAPPRAGYSNTKAYDRHFTFKPQKL